MNELKLETVEKYIEELIDRVKKISRENGDERKQLLICGEKYLHYLFYKIFNDHNQSYEIKWEYPTKQRYRTEKGKLIPDIKGKKKASFDIAILSGDQIFAALEFSLDFERNNHPKRSLNVKSFELHSKNDFEKLTNEKNKVKLGFIISFILNEEFSRASEGRRKKKEAQYRKCVEDCKEVLDKLCKQHERFHPKLNAFLIVADGGETDDYWIYEGQFPR